MNTNNIVMWVILPNNADWDCFKTLTSQENLEDSKSTSGGTLCIFGSHTFVPISWMCKKQTAVSHSSTESEIISLDTGLRLEWFACSGIMGSNLFLSLEASSHASDRPGQPGSDVKKHHKSQRRIDMMKDIIQFPQTSNPRVKKLYCMCLRTMKQ